MKKNQQYHSNDVLMSTGSSQDDKPSRRLSKYGNEILKKSTLEALTNSNKKGKGTALAKNTEGIG